MIRKLSIYYIIFVIAFTWGILVGYKKVFPYKYVSIIFKEFVAFYKGGKDIKDISVVEKITVLLKSGIIFFSHLTIFLSHNSRLPP